jgi:hypothetical protein
LRFAQIENGNPRILRFQECEKFHGSLFEALTGIRQTQNDCTGQAEQQEPKVHQRVKDEVNAMPTNTKESGLETLIVNWLVEHNGYEQGVNADYNGGEHHKKGEGTKTPDHDFLIAESGKATPDYTVAPQNSDDEINNCKCYFKNTALRVFKRWDRG